MTPLPTNLKKAAESAFRDNSLLSLISPQEREQAAVHYDAVASQTVGVLFDLARLYNTERAKFLRGQVPRIVKNAPTFAAETGYCQSEDKT